MTKCDNYKRMIQRALDGVLPALEGEGLSRHLATCAECRAEQAVMGRIQRLVVRTGTLPEGADVGPAFDARFYAALRRQSESSPLWVRIWKPLAAVGFAVGLVSVGLWRPWAPVPKTVSFQEDPLLSASNQSARSTEERTRADERARWILRGVPL